MDHRKAIGRRLPAALMAFASAIDVRADALSYDVVYTAELWSNLGGGIDVGSVYLDNLDATLELDAGKAWGWGDSRIFLYGLYNNGRALSAAKTGDLQTVSNIETGVSALRLYEAWLETGIAQSGSIRVGIYDLNSEFDVLDSSGLFMHSAHGIGTDFGQSGKNGPSIFPVTGLALRLHWAFDSDWSLRLAALDGVPGDPDDPADTTIKLGGNDGALLAAELERKVADGKLLFGAWAYTSEFIEWQRPASAEDQRLSRGNAGVYIRGETRLGNEDSGLMAFARYGRAAREYNTFSQFIGFGVRWAAPWGRRTADMLGIAVAWAETSSRFESARAADGQTVEEREIAFELTYRAPLTEWLTLQPDFQYIANPGLDPGLDDAWVFGIRLELTLL